MDHDPVVRPMTSLAGVQRSVALLIVTIAGFTGAAVWISLTRSHETSATADRNWFIALGVTTVLILPTGRSFARHAIAELARKMDVAEPGTESLLPHYVNLVILRVMLAAGPAMLAAVVINVTHQLFALVVTGLCLGSIAAVFPTRRRTRAFVEAVGARHD